jgi:hypothetical protein
MNKFLKFVIIMIVLSINKIDAIQFNEYINDFYVNLLNDNLKEVNFYNNKDLLYKYIKKNSVNKYFFELVPYKSTAEIKTIVIENSNKFILIKSYDKNNEILRQITFFLNNDIISKKIYEEPFRDDETLKILRWDKYQTDYIYSNNKLLKQIENNKIIREFLYKENKIEKVIYYLDQGIKTDKYNYQNNSDYICMPSSERWIFDKLYGLKDKKIQSIKLEMGKKIITNEYYNKNNLEQKDKIILEGDKVISTEDLNMLNNQLRIVDYIYNTN